MASFEAVCVGAGGRGLRTAVPRALEALRAGGILAHPTDTVYGLGGPATSACDRIVATMKGRDPAAFPILRIGATVEALRTAFPDLVWTRDAERLAEAFWPGPLTLVLADGTRAGVAIRVEGHPVTREVLRAWGGPIGSTSLNPAGAPPATTPAEVRSHLERMPDPGVPVVVLDAGPLVGAAPSTLVDLTGATPRILREGAISGADVLRCAGAQEAE